MDVLFVSAQEFIQNCGRKRSRMELEETYHEATRYSMDMDAQSRTTFHKDLTQKGGNRNWSCFQCEQWRQQTTGGVKAHTQHSEHTDGMTAKGGRVRYPKVMDLVKTSTHVPTWTKIWGVLKQKTAWTWWTQWEWIERANRGINKKWEKYNEKCCYTCKYNVMKIFLRI